MNAVEKRRHASPVWLGILATIAIVGLLLAFHHVVRGAVQQGELRRKATATHAEAAWRCNILRALDSCLVQQSAVPQDGAPLQARSVATGSDR
jgi:hypothetical protein